MDKKVLIIAEAGVNHNGDIHLARLLVDAATQSGADIVKFQTFTAEQLVTTCAPKADYQLRATKRGQTQFAMLKDLELSPRMHEDLISYCHVRGIEFLSTAFDLNSLAYLGTLGLKRFKIPSGEITNLPYLRQVGYYGKPLILSTGMSTLGEIEAAIQELEAAGTPRSLITVLHCNTAYPTPAHDVNLKAIESIKSAFGVEVGYSDHTLGIEVAIAAVALGAIVIEKHLTLDRSLPGPDQQASLEPKDFADMVRSIRTIEEAMGDGIKRISQSELGNSLVVRKSLVAAKEIRAGEEFTKENLSAKRPGTGISPMRLNEILGRVAGRNFAKDELIEF